MGIPAPEAFTGALEQRADRHVPLKSVPQCSRVEKQERVPRGTGVDDGSKGLRIGVAIEDMLRHPALASDEYELDRHVVVSVLKT